MLLLIKQNMIICLEIILPTALLTNYTNFKLNQTSELKKEKKKLNCELIK